MDPLHGLPARVGLVQVRPMRTVDATVEVGAEELDDERVVVASELTLGNGVRSDLSDVVMLPPERFDRLATGRIAAELEGLNGELVDQGRPYLLLGFGRWGTTDPSMGVPVLWGQIAGAAVIVEATLPEVDPELSQGSHFFHNLLGRQVLYLSVPHDGPHPIDWRWLSAQPVHGATEHAVHLRLERPLRVRVDGRQRRGVIEREP
jgi:hypothetical protein